MDSAASRIASILLASGTDGGALPPTALYNEGWMLRLVLDWFSRHPPSAYPLAFWPGARWYSEALLRSPFRPRHRRDRLAEGSTHADGVVGHLHIRPGRGDVVFDPQARQFVVIEAKLFSPLASGTQNAKAYNQAARNIACMAELVSRADVGAFERLAFVVLAPDEQIRANVFADLCTRPSIAQEVERRVASYDGGKDSWHRDAFMPALERIEPHVHSWEDVLAHITAADQPSGDMLRAFYEKCMDANRPVIRSVAHSQASARRD